jgi:hypothetical protein
MATKSKPLVSREIQVNKIIKSHIKNAPDGAMLIDSSGDPCLAQMLSRPLKYLKAWKYEDGLIKEALHTIYRLSRAYKKLGFDKRHGRFGIDALHKISNDPRSSIAEAEILHWSLRIGGAIATNIIQENNEREELWEVIYKANGSYGYLICLAGVKPEEFKKMGRNEQLQYARDKLNEPPIKMRVEANRLFESGNFKSKKSASKLLKSAMIVFGLNNDVGFEFQADDIEITIYNWLLYPSGKPKRQK